MSGPDHCRDTLAAVERPASGPDLSPRLQSSEPDSSKGRRSDGTRATAFGAAVGFTTFVATATVLGNLRPAAAWGVAAGAVAARARPNLFFGWAAALLLLSPALALLDLDRPAEDVASSALFLLAVAVALEFRQPSGGELRSGRADVIARDD